jgi:hypothetical protein
MSAEPQPLNGQRPAPDLIDRIANALPEELRADYYRELSHCRNLPESDEMLRILRAMQFLTVLINRAPAQVAGEREQLAQVLAQGIESIQATHRASVAYQQQLEARIAKLPDEIAKGISAEAIAVKISESLRQQFHETGLPIVADAIAVQAKTLRQASKELSAAAAEFTNPRTGAMPRINEVFRWLKDDLQNAADHIRAQMNGLGKELYRTIAVFCFGTLVIGFVGGTLYQRRMDAPVTQTPTATVQSAPPPVTTPQPNHRKKQQPSAPAVQ